MPPSVVSLVGVPPGLGTTQTSSLSGTGVVVLLEVGELRAVRRPGRASPPVSRGRAGRDRAKAAAVGVDDVDLAGAGAFRVAVRRERDLRSVRRPRRILGEPDVAGQADAVAPVGVCDEQIRPAPDARPGVEDERPGRRRRPRQREEGETAPAQACACAERDGALLTPRADFRKVFARVRRRDGPRGAASDVGQERSPRRSCGCRLRGAGRCRRRWHRREPH